MKSLVLVAMLFLTACASTTSEKTSGSTYQPKTIRVIGTGKTFDEAKVNGFNSAIEIVVGSVILTDQEARNGTLVRDDIAKHSAGYVDNYTIVNQTQTNRGFTLVIDVDVKSSKIAERMLNRGTSEGVINGTKVADKYNSYIHDKKTGDKFINTVLESYPKHAFNIKQGNIDFKVDAYRNSVIVIPTEISWNYEWLTAFNEALSVVQDGDSRSFNRITVISKKPGAWNGSPSVFHFNDTARVEKITQRMIGGNLTLVKIIADNGSTLHTECFYNLSADFGGGDYRDNRRNVVNGHQVDNKPIEITVKQGSQLQQNFKNMNHVEMSVIPERGAQAVCTGKSLV